MFALITKLFLGPRETSSRSKMHHKFWAKFGNPDHSVSLRFAKKKSSNRLGKKSVLQFCQSSEIGKNEKKSAVLFLCQNYCDIQQLSNLTCIRKMLQFIDANHLCCIK